MFSLVITVISIALVAALAAAAIYYGGSAFRSGGDAAVAAQTVNEAQQIRGAMSLRQAITTEPVTDLQTLVDENYLKQVPGGWTAIDDYSAKLMSSVDQCLLANEKVGVHEVPTCEAYLANPGAYGGKALCCSYAN